MLSTQGLVIWFVSSLLLYLTAMVVPGFKISSFMSAMLAALVVGFLNMFLRPLLIFLSLPITIMTLGSFIFVVNAVILRLAAGMLKGFDINGWVPAILGALVLAVMQVVSLNLFGI